MGLMHMLANTTLAKHAFGCQFRIDRYDSTYYRSIWNAGNF